MITLLQSNKDSDVSWLLHSIGDKRQQGEMACPFNGDDEHSLVFRASASDALRDDASLL